MVLYEEMHKGVTELLERDLEEGTKTFCMLIEKDQPSLRPNDPMGKLWSLVEAKPQSYRAAYDSTHLDIWIAMMRQKF